VRLFLDTSVLLSACGSEQGASRELFRLAPTAGWFLITTPYVLQEVTNNLRKLTPAAAHSWPQLKPNLLILDDIVTLDRPSNFGPGKDRPILFSALAWADVLLTLDIGDFGGLIGGNFYELPVLKPGDFLIRERSAGRL
jgi:predicted nucleic acid-binding protein